MIKFKKVYEFDETYSYIGETIAQYCQFTMTLMLPPRTTEIKPLEAKEGFKQVWNGEIWEYVELPKEVVNESTENNSDFDNGLSNVEGEQTNND